MKLSGAPFFGHLRPLLIAVVIAAGGCDVSVRAPVVAQVPAVATPPLSANDVSWLFPPPTKVADLEKLIAVRDLTTQNPQDSRKRDPVWTDAVFRQFVGIAASPAAQVAGTQNRIGLPADAQSMDAWFIAGIRIDAGGPRALSRY